MKISHLNSVTHLCLIMSIVVLGGCTPEEGLVNTGPGPGRSISSVEVQMPYVSGPVIDIEMEPEAEEAVGENSTESARTLVLLGGSPNPFNPATELSFAVPEDGGEVTLTIHGVDGRCARRLVAATLPGGKHSVVWRGRDDTGRKLPSGVYFARLRSGGEVRIRKLVMVQ